MDYQNLWIDYKRIYYFVRNPWFKFTMQFLIYPNRVQYKWYKHEYSINN